MVVVGFKSAKLEDWIPSGCEIEFGSLQAGFFNLAGFEIRILRIRLMTNRTIERRTTKIQQDHRDLARARTITDRAKGEIGARQIHQP
ncbi:MAG: hypothetical protein OSB69_13335 [Alphaproteobacteria bacterium]|nr:hypothetical protein [Alphaproteobacteria bacterium]